MALIMSTKEDSELSTIKKASTATVDVFTRYLKEQIMDIVDRDKKVSQQITKIFTYYSKSTSLGSRHLKAFA